jgi:uncharacterized lipoprotein YddW (UPF0748 family)
MAIEYPNCRFENPDFQKFSVFISCLVFLFISPCFSLADLVVPKIKSPKFYVWMGEGKNHSNEYLETQFKRLKEAGADGVMYLCSADRYPGVIAIAQRSGLEIHAWQVILNCRDKQVMENHKDWFTVNSKGESSLENPPYVGYYKWLCPSNLKVQDYVVKKVTRIADIQGVKSVHLDYIRHSDVILPIGLWDKYDLVMDREYPEFDFCYCDVCIQKFREQTGIDPSKLADPSQNEEWRQYRCDSITRLVNRLAEVVHQKGKLLTAAVFPTPIIAKKLVRQDWVNWKLDMVYPMVYHSFYEKDMAWIEDAVRQGVKALASKVPLYSGLYMPSLNPDELVKAIDNSFAGGAAGICLFGYESMNEDHWKKFIKAVKRHTGKGGNS